jgi:hypothetical protein
MRHTKKKVTKVAGINPAMSVILIKCEWNTSSKEDPGMAEYICNSALRSWGRRVVSLGQ